MTTPLSRSAATAVAGCIAVSLAAPAVASAATSHPAAPAKSASASKTIKSGKTKLQVGADAANLELRDGFTITAVKPAKVDTTTLTATFPVTGGKVNLSKETGTIKQAGGLSISKNGKTIVIKNAVANLKTRTATATTTGKGKTFSALKLGKPQSGSSNSIGGYTISLSKQAIKYLDKVFKTKDFKKYNELGTGTTTLKFKK